MGKGWITSGNAYGLQDGSTYIKNHNTLTPFIWGGRCWRLEDSSETLGGLTVTTRFNPRGGIERDTVRAEPPGETSGTLVMKRLQFDRAKSDLRTCYWDIDQRMQCGGMDRDAWERWEEITRYCQTKFNERGVPGTSWEGDEDALINLPYVALSVDDIYRVGGSEKWDTTQNRAYTDIDSCQPGRCPDHCDDQEDCVVVAVTVKKEANGDPEAPYLVVNLAGGDDDNWTPNQLATMVGHDATRVLCLGSFVVVIASGYGIMHTDDLGTTEIYIANASVTAWAAGHLPLSIDGIDQTFILIGCEEGYITASYDAARTWETVSSGEATTQDIDDIMIARDNPQVIYASTETNKVVIKSENGGRTWFALGAIGMGGTGPTALYVINQSTVLVGNDAGEVWQTVDGGTAWTQQSDLPGAGAGTSVVNDITGCGCGVLYMAVEEDGGAHARIYRNIDGGAEGRWYEPADIGDLRTATGAIEAITCCGPNHAVGVGGNGTTDSASILIE